MAKLKVSVDTAATEVLNYSLAEVHVTSSALMEGPVWGQLVPVDKVFLETTVIKLCALHPVRMEDDALVATGAHVHMGLLVRLVKQITGQAHASQCMNKISVRE